MEVIFLQKDYTYLPNHTITPHKTVFLICYRCHYFRTYKRLPIMIVSKKLHIVNVQQSCCDILQGTCLKMTIKRYDNTNQDSRNVTMIQTGYFYTQFIYVKVELWPNNYAETYASWNPPFSFFWRSASPS